MIRLKCIDECEEAMSDERVGCDAMHAWKHLSAIVSKKESKEALKHPESSKEEREMILLCYEETVKSLKRLNEMLGDKW